MSEPDDKEKEARANLELAAKARRLAPALPWQDRLDMERFADELEKRAAALGGEVVAFQPASSVPVTREQQQVQQQQAPDPEDQKPGGSEKKPD